MDSSELRTSRLEAYEEIRKCVFSYALAGDRGNLGTIVRKVFARDASYEAAGMVRFVGLDEIVRGLEETANSVVVWAFHVPGGPLIELADDLERAKAFWWVWIPAVIQDQGIRTPHWGAGHYNADLIVEDGRWKFKRVLFETKLRTPFEGPWTQIDGSFEWPNV